MNTVNINDKVRVKLTCYGEEVYRRYIYELETVLGTEVTQRIVSKAVVALDGTKEFQLHELMRIFGKSGYDAPWNGSFVGNKIEFP